MTTVTSLARVHYLPKLEFFRARKRGGERGAQTLDGDDPSSAFPIRPRGGIGGPQRLLRSEAGVLRALEGSGGVGGPAMIPTQCCCGAVRTDEARYGDYNRFSSSQIMIFSRNVQG